MRIDGDVAGQQGIRFNILPAHLQLLRRGRATNIGPKGPHPAEPSTAVDLPTNLRDNNAIKQGLPGALYPMVTFTGVECHNEWEITFEEIHRNAIAHAIYTSHAVPTGDRSYLDQYGIDVLLGIARFWAGACIIPSARINT